MSDNPAKIAELQSDKLVAVLLSKNLGVPVCRHIESKGHNGQQFVKPEYVIETFPSVEFLRSVKLLKLQIRSLVSVRKELHVETSTVPYLEINNASAAASSSSSKTTTTTTTSLTAEEAEKILQEAASHFTGGNYSEAVGLYSQVISGISFDEPGPLKAILSRAFSNRSGCYLSLKQPNEAIVDARKCCDLRNDWCRAHIRVAAAAEALEDFDLVISTYEAAVATEDFSTISKKDLGQKILEAKANREEAEMKTLGEGEELDVTLNRKITDDELISQVKACKNLVKLNVCDSTAITDKAIVFVGENCRNLKEFLAWRTGGRITDTGICALAEGCKNLQVLNIVNTRGAITDVAIRAIAKNCQNLHTLMVNDTGGRITDVGIIAIAEGCKDLRMLGIGGNRNMRVIGDSLLLIRQKFPNCQIYA